MTDSQTRATAVPSLAPSSLPDHPVRIALLDLLAELGSVTSTEAARRLGHSSGLCSFHLRQLARHGLIEEVPGARGRVRPWRLRWEAAEDQEPDASFREVLHLTPAEQAGLAAAMRRLLAPYRHDADRPGTRPVEVVARLVPSAAGPGSDRSGASG